MTTTDAQEARYWLTPAGCAAVGSHQPDLDLRHCRLCGARTQEAGS